MHKTIAGLTIAAVMVPAFAFADSSNLQTQIQSLLSQIQALQQQLKTLIASSSVSSAPTWSNGTTTPSWMPSPGQVGKQMCLTLTRNLVVGSQGDDVKSVQQMLSDDGDFRGPATGFFGPLTAKAMTNFQTRMGIASSSTGTVGPLTRGFFERRCGNGLGGGVGNGMGGGMNGCPGGSSCPVHPEPWGVAARGTISANNTSSITVQTNNGSVVVNISTSTTIDVFNSTSTAQTVGSVTDLAVGKQVEVGGPKNSDGSINAMTIVVGDNLPPEMGPSQQSMGPQGGMPPDGRLNGRY